MTVTDLENIKEQKLIEEFKKDFWSPKDDNMTPLDFCIKWWIKKRKEEREKTKKTIKQISEKYQEECSDECISKMTDELLAEIK